MELLRSVLNEIHEGFALVCRALGAKVTLSEKKPIESEPNKPIPIAVALAQLGGKGVAVERVKRG